VIDVHEETLIDVHGNWQVKRIHATEANRRRTTQGMHAYSARSVVAMERHVKSQGAKTEAGREGACNMHLD
jgi:hypothetical protein